VTRHLGRVLVWLLFVLGCGVSPAFAQVAPGSVRWVEVDLGGGLLGGARLGTVDANLRANVPAEQPYRLFTADHRFARTPELHVRAARPFGRRWAIEGGVTISHPVLRADVSADIEGAPALAITETVDQYFIDAAVVIAFDELRLGRLVPFATGGAGYLRQLHEGLTLIEHGQLFVAGVGVKYPFVSRAAGFVRTAGLRGDVRGYVLRGGIAVDDRPRPHVAISGGLFIGL